MDLAPLLSKATLSNRAATLTRSLSLTHLRDSSNQATPAAVVRPTRTTATTAPPLLANSSKVSLSSSMTSTATPSRGSAAWVLWQWVSAHIPSFHHTSSMLTIYPFGDPRSQAA